jgi:hypothetical protein
MKAKTMLEALQEESFLVQRIILKAKTILETRHVSPSWGL